MRATDLVSFAWQVVRSYPGRTLLTLLAMGIGVAAVVAVTALGEGARLYVVNQFGSLGTNLVIVLPGRSETAGAMPGVLVGKTPRDLTLEDALALNSSRAIRCLAPLIVGAGVEFKTDGVISVAGGTRSSGRCGHYSRLRVGSRPPPPVST